MAIELFNHESCVTSSKIKSAFCTEMRNSLFPDFKQYMIPLGTMLTSEILSIYIAVKVGEFFQLKKVQTADWTLQTGNKFTINNQDPADLSMYNRVIVIPKAALNLCFTGVAGSNISNKRALWVKRSDTTKMYDYIAITSIDHFADFYTILEFPNIQFANGVGTGFTNLTSLHTNMKIDFDGQYVGAISSVTGASTVVLDTNYTSTGLSRAFVYAQGTLEYALDINGVPGTWQRHLNIPQIDHDIPYKFWVRDFKTVSSDLTVYANNAIRILGTEFIL